MPGTSSPPARYGRRATLTAFASFAAVAVVGCGQPPPPTVADIVQKTAAAADASKSIHFELTIEGAPAYLDKDKTLNLRHAEGDVARPDRSQLRARVAVGGWVASIRFVNIGTTAYMTDPLSAKWAVAPPGLGYNAAMLYDAEWGVGAVIKAMDGATKQADEAVDGVDSYHLTGAIATEKLLVLTGGVLPGPKVTMDVWSSKTDFSVRRIRLTEIGAAKTPMTWTLVLTKHDEPVTIEAPI